MRIRIDLQYDGTGFSGWQRQPNRPTVQGVLEEHLRRVLGEPDLAIVGQGRTDAGAHALMQVAHFDSGTKIPAKRLPGILNPRLAELGVCLLSARPVEQSFHSRYSATCRTYCYVLYISERPPPVFLMRYSHHVLPPLAIEKVREAMRLFLGRHDFAAFCASDWEGKTTVRDMVGASLICDGSLVVFVFKANAFLHKMVRHIVGALLEVGRGNISADLVGELLRGGAEAGKGRPAWRLPPAKGLFLVRVEYPGDVAEQGEAEEAVPYSSSS